MDADEAKLKQSDTLLAKLRAALNLELVEGLPEQVDGFNPNGWMLFACGLIHTPPALQSTSPCTARRDKCSF
jgi:hypothetical protein